MLRVGRTLHIWRLRLRQQRAQRRNHRSLEMLIQSDEGGEIPADLAQWVYSVTKQGSVPNANDFLIDSGAATSECPQSLADSLGGKTRGP